MTAAVLTPPPVAQRVPVSSVRETVLRNLERVESYPTLSATAVRAAALVHNPNTSAGELATLIRGDGVLAAAVLRSANSLAYRGRSAVADIRQAVVRVGLQECGRLISTLGVKGLYDSHPPGVRRRCEILLRHSLFVAHISTGLNRAVALGFAGAEFTGGLLHDIGRVIACVNAPTDAVVADPLDFREDGETLARERDLLGIDHCAIGYQFAMRNGLPEAIVRVVLNHHRPHEEQLQRDLVALVAVADRVANHAQSEREIARYQLAACPAFAVLAAGWAPDRQATLQRALPEVVVKALRDTRRMLKTCA